MPKHLLSIDDLSDEEIDRILERASEFERDGSSPSGESRIVGLLFGQTSLRTRVGFAAAAARLGWPSIDILERRHDSTSMIESWADTLRTLGGYLDLLVARPGEHLERKLLADSLPIPYISGGGVGARAEHPSQALIDVHAIESELGSIGELRVAICGDIRMRAVRSLLKLFTRRPPQALVFVTVPALQGYPSTADETGCAIEERTLAELAEIDVLYVAGIPHQAIPESVRDTLRVTEQTLELLPPESIVLSPLPIIDEIGEEAREDPRVRMFEQSDRALFVRMALLEHAANTP